MEITIKFVKEDVWVGLFWRRAKHVFYHGVPERVIQVFVCLLPCFPIRLTFREHSKEAA